MRRAKIIKSKTGPITAANVNGSGKLKQQMMALEQLANSGANNKTASRTRGSHGATGMDMKSVSKRNGEIDGTEEKKVGTVVMKVHNSQVTTTDGSDHKSSIGNVSAGSEKLTAVTETFTGRGKRELALLAANTIITGTRRTRAASSASVTNAATKAKASRPVGVKKSALIKELITLAQDDVNHHPTRSMNSNDDSTDRIRKVPLKLPNPRSAAGRRLWHKVDKAVTAEWLKGDRLLQMDVKCMVPMFNEWLYSFLTKHAADATKGVKSGVSAATAARRKVNYERGQKRMRHKLEMLRVLKREVKRKWSQLSASIDVNADEMVKVKKEYRKLLKKYSSLRRRMESDKVRSASIRQQKQFREQPYKFTVNAIKCGGGAKVGTTAASADSSSSAPTFDAATATAYFSRTYSDSTRSQEFNSTNVNGARPSVPDSTADYVLQLCEAPSRRDIWRSIKRKSNGASPGLNGINYVPYKYCSRLVCVLQVMFTKIWKSGYIPPEWGQGCIVLLAKSDKLSDPAEFRPIALTDCDGKIFFSIISRNLEQFMIKSGMLNRSIQKGFLSGVAGCQEHGYALERILYNARKYRKACCVVWIDLANAYGSIKHNLIQFALAWYHVPKIIRDIIYAYYELLCAKVVTKQWSTDWFAYEIGLFQGCVLSTILFDIVFNMLLDRLRELDCYGYQVDDDTGDVIQSFCKAYADDLTLITSRADQMTSALQVTEQWLTWTSTMKAKPSKCRYVAMTNTKVTDDSKKVKDAAAFYQKVDLKIAGQPIEGIDIGFFKFLGRKLWYDGDEKEVKKELEQKLLSLLKVIDSLLVTNLMKVWMYQNYVVVQFSWPFMVYKLSRSYVKGLQQTANIQLKRWLGLPENSDDSILFRGINNHGLGLTALEHHFISMQLVHSSLMKHSLDADIRILYTMEEKKVSEWNRWTPHGVLADAENDTKWQQLIRGQCGRSGVGSNFKLSPAHMSLQRLRRAATAYVKEQGINELLKHTGTLKLHGNWLKWSDQVVSSSLLSIDRLAMIGNARVIKFHLQANMQCVPTPAVKAVWHQSVRKNAAGSADKSCPICGYPHCNLKHIISACRKALMLRRFHWRHDEVLRVLVPLLTKHLEMVNSKPVKTSKGAIHFIREGDEQDRQERNIRRKKEMVARDFEEEMEQSVKFHNWLLGGNDWQIVADIGHQLTFPAKITVTHYRPDIVIWSESLRVVIILELTVPYEDNIADVHDMKWKKYDKLRNQILEEPPDPISGKRWSVILHPWEMGARGYCAHSTVKMLSQLGFTRSAMRGAIDSMVSTVMRCSYRIFLSYRSKGWNEGVSYNTSTTGVGPPAPMP